MNSDGSGQVKLSSGEQDADPAWSPDGSKIIFASWDNPTSQIYTMIVDGIERVRLTDLDGLAQRPSWSPDGERVAFDANVAGNYHIWVVNADGTNLTDLTPNSRYGYDTEPDWSPDGTRIAFTSIRSGGSETYVIEADGNNVTRVTNSGENRDPTWSSDGKRIAFSHGNTKPTIQIAEVGK